MSSSAAGSSDLEPSLLKQTLLNLDEVFIYKIPPLRTSGGHRAEDWDLAKPLKTCGLQVERRGNELFLLFTTDDHTKLFALSKYVHDNSIESVVDSSRYFVCALAKNGAPSGVYIGFGVRDREAAVDLKAALQQFALSIRRESEASEQVAKAVAKLHLGGEGGKIHVALPGGSRPRKEKQPKTPTGSASGGLLLRKPPPAGDAGAQSEATKPESAAESVSTSKNDDTAVEVAGGDDDDWGDFQGA